MDELRGLFEGTYTRTMRIAKIMGAVLLLLGIGCLLIPMGKHDPMTAKIFIALVFAGPGGFLLWVGVRPFEKHPFVQALERPEEIAWHWFVDNHYNGTYTFSFVHLGLVTGKVPRLKMPPGKRAEVAALLKRRAPRATSGFDPAHQASFKNDPRSLLTP